MLHPNFHPIWQTFKPALESDVGVTELYSVCGKVNTPEKTKNERNVAVHERLLGIDMSTVEFCLSPSSIKHQESSPSRWHPTLIVKPKRPSLVAGAARHHSHPQRKRLAETWYPILKSCSSLIPRSKLSLLRGSSPLLASSPAYLASPGERLQTRGIAVLDRPCSFDSCH